MRQDGRAPQELRSTSIQPDYLRAALGSVLIATGHTRVICSVSPEPKAPPWLDSGGWVTAQYAMLPGATSPRGRRDPGGRGKEIQRLIGRSLRAAVDLQKLVGPSGPVSLVCDCDVIDADGGTRTASITGAWVAMAIAIRKLLAQGRLTANPLRAPLAATSVGVVQRDGAPVALLDLCYEEDSAAEVDLNVVKLGTSGYVEVQGTAEGEVFSRDQLTSLLDLADGGIAQLFELQTLALEAAE